MAPASPRVSVVVPTHARPAQLATCLRALAALDYPRDRYEVVVVDDGSPEPPIAEVRAAEAELELTFLSQRRSGPAAARNAGAARASGELLAFTDDDCIPDRGWLEALCSRLASDPDLLVGGLTVNGLARNPYAAAAQTIVSHLYAYSNNEPGAARFLASNNIALAAEPFRAVGGFDERFPRAAAEDREFCDRWRRHGHRIGFVPAAVVCHAHPLSLRSLWRQQFEYGRGTHWYHELTVGNSKRRPRPQPAAFYVGLLRMPFEDGVHRPLRVASLIALSQVANAAGFAWQALRRGAPDRR